MPTSRATRVTSDVNTPSCLIMVFTIVAERRNSPASGRPSTSSSTVCSRFPCATAAIARVTSVIGRTRSSISVLYETCISLHAPRARATRVRWRILPSLPTTWPTRAISLAMSWFSATISLKRSAILPSRPVQSVGSRTEKSPSRTASSPCNSTRRSGVGLGGTLSRLRLAAVRTAGGISVLRSEGEPGSENADPPRTGTPDLGMGPGMGAGMGMGAHNCDAAEIPARNFYKPLDRPVRQPRPRSFKRSAGDAARFGPG